MLRDGKWTKIQARELVPGDIIRVRLGDLVPADAKILEGTVEVDQSALTGESMAVEKGEGDVLFSGSVVRRGGEATCIVMLTGSHTYFGKTTELVKNAGSKSHIESLIFGIVRNLIILDIVLVLGIIAFSLLEHVSINQVLPFSLVVLIASVPVALPATFTIAMAIGALEMSKKGVLVTRLNAIEDAASMDVICMDKTGTITENRLRVVKPRAYKGSDEELIMYACLASDEASQDPIDLAIISYAKEQHISVNYANRTEFKPFDPSTKRTEAVIDMNGKKLTIIKGAPPQVVAKLCKRKYEEIEQDVESYASRGFRVIAVAVGGKELELLGIIPLYDKPRPDSKELITELNSFGVHAKMVTGDNYAIAKEVGAEVGMEGHVCTVQDIKEGKDSIDDCSIFAEVFPEDKFLIVKGLQDGGHVTGMTGGDGVNDAPALKQAEVGIAVSNATDVAKASASIVLTHEGISDIVEAVKSGRRIYQRMLTYTLNKIMKTMQVVIFLTTSFLVVRFFVTTPFDVILLLFANDFVTMSIATDNVRYSMKPERWNVKALTMSSGILSALLVLEGFIVLWLGLKLGLRPSGIHTLVFDTLVFSGLFTVLMVRERKRFWHSMPSKWLALSIVIDIIVISSISVAGILVTPIPLMDVLITLAFTFSWMILMDLVKNYVFKYYDL